MSRTYNTKKVYREHFGDIPEGRHIHHIDGDPTNDSPDNLIPVSRAMHKAMHEDRYKELGLKKDWFAAHLLGGTDYSHPSHSEEAKKKMAERRKGKTPWNKGIKTGWLGGGRKAIRHEILQHDLNGEFIKEYNYMKDLPNGIRADRVLKCCRGERFQHKGYRWSFKNDNYEQ